MPPDVSSDNATKTFFTAATKPRTKQPPYPRPVPQICAEEVALRPDDVAFYTRYSASVEELRGDGSDADVANEEAEKRAAKRRRIELNAQAYLRGEQLYIMSAQLRGPFGVGWKNPWAKKSRTLRSEKRNRTTTTEFPEQKQDNYEIPATATRKESGDLTSSQEKRSTVLEAKKRWLTRNDAGPEEPAPLLVQAEETSRPSPVPFAQVIRDIEKRTPRDKPAVMVEQWLRTSEAFAGKSGDPASQTSPTPVKGHQTLRTPVSKGQVDQSSTMHDEKQHAASAFSRAQQLSRNFAKICEQSVMPVGDAPAEIHSTSHIRPDVRGDDGTLPRGDRPPRLSPQTEPEPGIQQLTEAKTSPEGSLLRNLERIESSFDGEDSKHGQPVERDTALEAQVDAEQASQRLQRIAQAATQVYEMRCSQEEMEGKARSLDAGIAQVEDPASKYIAPTMLHVDQYANAAQEEAKKPHRPGMHPETSAASTNDMLPSAQMVPKLQHTESSGVLEVQMLGEELSGSKLDEAGAKLAVHGHLHGEMAKNAPERLESDTGRPPAQDSNVMSCSYTHANGNTSYSATKQTSLLTFGGVQKTSKTKPEKKRKRASFAPDASGSMVSLKTSMNAKVGKKLVSPASFSFSKENMALEASDDEYGTAKKVSRTFVSVGSAPTKGILKCTNSCASPVSIRQSKGGLSTGQQPTGKSLIEEGQNGMNGDDEDFDLGAAIDDLGSFLGSWSAEKEASGILE